MAFIPLSNPVNIKTSAIFSDYKEAKPIPYPFGRVRIEPIPINQKKIEFIVAYKRVTVNSVYRDDAETKAFDQRIEQNDYGDMVTYIALRTPLAEGERLEADISTQDGDKINPSAIVDEIITKIIGGDSISSRLSEFFAQCNNLGISLSGIIANNQITAKSIIDDIMINSGGVWCGSMRDFARIYPLDRPSHFPISANFDKLSMQDTSCAASSSETYTVITINYGYNFATNEPGGSITLKSKQGFQEYGEIKHSIDARWVPDQSQAISLGSRLLKHFSRDRWLVTFSSSNQFDSVRIGDYITINHPVMPTDGDAECFVMSHNLIDGGIELSAEFVVGDEPSIILVAVTTKGLPEAPQGLIIEFSNGVLTLTILDDNDNPIIGAEVTLDGDVTKQTNDTGKVSFSNITVGDHSAHVEASGFVSQDFGFSI